jgi:hypothetical protein
VIYPPLALVLAGLVPSGVYVTIECQAFFDESASHDGAPILCIAGLIFKKSEAIKLGHEWSKVLRWKKLPYFHMVECAHGNGVFAKLSKDERSEVAKRMIDIIKARAVQIVAVTIDKRDFKSVMAENASAAKAYPTPYSFVSHTVMAGVRAWIYANPRVGRMHYVFEDGHDSAPQARRAMGDIFKVPEKREQYRYAGFSFVPKRDSYAVQAADLVAWQWYKDKKNLVEGRPRRKDCESLLELHHNAAHLDRDGLIAMLRDVRVWAKILDAGPLTPIPDGVFQRLPPR